MKFHKSIEVAALGARLSAVFDDWIEPFVDPEHSVPLRRLLDLIEENATERRNADAGAPYVTEMERRAIALAPERRISGPDPRPTPTLLVTLPRIFAEDHRDRGCLTGRVTRESGNVITFRIVNADTFDDWLSDAKQYSNRAGWDFDDDKVRVHRSAKRAYKALYRLRPAACRKFGHNYKKLEGTFDRCQRCEHRAIPVPQTEVTK